MKTKEENHMGQILALEEKFGKVCYIADEIITRVKR